MDHPSIPLAHAHPSRARLGPMARAADTLELTGCDVTRAKARRWCRPPAHAPPARRAALSARPQILVVGAGGIGCELVKNLVLSGFLDITMIDLDTIDYSNLNRQFLFRKEHVGRSKCEVAREAVLRFPHDDGLRITAHHGNIKESRFDLDFFKTFSIVLNALDNVDARRHVNRCCLAAAVPLIESGTTGYLGQARAIIKGRSSCCERRRGPNPRPSRRPSLAREGSPPPP